MTNEEMVIAAAINLNDTDSVVRTICTGRIDEKADGWEWRVSGHCATHAEARARMQAAINGGSVLEGRDLNGRPVARRREDQPPA